MKKGDKIVCINKYNNFNNLCGSECEYLTLHKVYTVLNVDEYYVSIIDDEGDHIDLFEGRFITLKEYRKLKLDKIKSRL